MFRAICVVITIVALLMLFHYGRYELASNGDVAAYKLDRLTGKVTFYAGDKERQIREAIPRK